MPANSFQYNARNVPGVEVVACSGKRRLAGELQREVAYGCGVEQCRNCNGVVEEMTAAPSRGVQFKSCVDVWGKVRGYVQHNKNLCWLKTLEVVGLS